MCDGGWSVCEVMYKWSHALATSTGNVLHRCTLLFLLKTEFHNIVFKYRCCFYFFFKFHNSLCDHRNQWAPKKTCNIIDPYLYKERSLKIKMLLFLELVIQKKQQKTVMFFTLAVGSSVQPVTGDYIIWQNSCL